MKVYFHTWATTEILFFFFGNNSQKMYLIIRSVYVNMIFETLPVRLEKWETPKCPKLWNRTYPQNEKSDLTRRGHTSSFFFFVVVKGRNFEVSFFFQEEGHKTDLSVPYRSTSTTRGGPSRPSLRLRDKGSRLHMYHTPDYQTPV